jgi:hypothetical protein
VRAMDGPRTRFAGEMGGGRFFLLHRKKLSPYLVLNYTTLSVI